MHNLRFIDPRRDPWQPVNGEDGPVPHPDPAPQRLLTLEQWHAVREHWPAGLATGVVLPNTLDVESLAADVRGPAAPLALLVLQFPKWTDGRAYSQAHLLRTRLGFEGELRAVGDVLVDMLPLLQRCGIDAVQLRHDQSVEAAVHALGRITAHYQGDLRQPQPLFARDRRAAASSPAAPDAGVFAGQGI